MNRSSGFTLIELMIVVAIIAILAALAIPGYRDYLIRTQVTEGSNLVSSAKIAVEEYYWYYGVAPNDNDDAGLPIDTQIKGDYVSAVTVSVNGTITAAFAGPRTNSAIASSVLQLVPDWSVPGSTVWRCNGVGTTVDDRYLPASCR